MQNTQFDLDALTLDLMSQLAMQPGHDRSKSSWNDDERHDRRLKTRTLQVLLVQPGALPELVTIANELSVFQGLISGLMITFDTGVENTIGVANDEAILCQMPPNRFVPSTNALIFGPLFIAGDGVNFHSLAPNELTEAIGVFAPPLRSEQVRRALRAHDETLDWIDRELNEALDE